MFQFRVRRVLLLIAATVLLGVAGQPLLAQCYNNVSVDENGNGFFICAGIGATPTTPIAFTSSGQLVYTPLPFAITAGDLILNEPGGVAAVVTDVLRFSSDGGSKLTFFSDSGDGVDALADGTLPTVFQSNTSTQTEVGAEGSNGFTWTPLPGQPGAIVGLTFSNVTYTIISDSASVPEPSTILLAIPAAGLIWLRRRKARV